MGFLSHLWSHIPRGEKYNSRIYFFQSVKGKYLKDGKNKERRKQK